MNARLLAEGVLYERMPMIGPVVPRQIDRLGLGIPAGELGHVGGQAFGGDDAHRLSMHSSAGRVEITDYAQAGIVAVRPGQAWLLPPPGGP